MEKKYILHTSSGAQLVTESQAIANALEQKKSGINPHYCFLTIKTKKQQRRRGGLFGQLVRMAAV